EEQQQERRAWQDSLAYDEFLAGRALRASDLIGAPVLNEEGERLGEIKDLIVSREDDVIEAIVGVGGVFGVGEKDIGVPYERLRVSSDGETLFLAMTREQLEAQPAYDPERATSSGAQTSNARSAAAAAAGQQRRAAEPQASERQAQRQAQRQARQGAAPPCCAAG